MFTSFVLVSIEEYTSLIFNIKYWTRLEGGVQSINTVRSYIFQRWTAKLEAVAFCVSFNWYKEKGSTRTSFVPADWQVRVFGPSGLIDIPYGCMYVQSIHMSGCLDIRSHYTPSYSQS